MPLAVLRGRTGHPKSVAPDQPPSASTQPPPTKETDLDRILKLIPTEILAFYTAAVPLAPEVPWRFFSFALFVACFALVPVVLYLDGQSTGVKAPWQQYVVRMLAFVAWAIAISWPFSAWSNGVDFNYVRSLAVLLVPLVGSLLLPRGASGTARPPASPQFGDKP